jgi:hypothetical protein
MNTKKDDFLDRQLFQKADLDYIPGLDYDLGPVFLPSKNIHCFRLVNFMGFVTNCNIIISSIVAALDESPEMAKARAEETARKKEAAAQAEMEAKKKEEAARLIKPILPSSSLFIFSSTNPYD